MSGDGVYVYGIVRAGHPKRPPRRGGVGAPPAALRILREGPVAAVVSSAPAGLRARRRDLLAHQEVLLELGDPGPLLPMRFGMVAPGEAVVRERLVADRDEHLRTLDRLAGRVEVNLKVLPAVEALAALVSQDPGIRDLRTRSLRRPGYEANLRLGEAVAGALSRRAAEAAGVIVRELEVLADAVAHGPQVPGCALNVSFLVSREVDGRFRSAVDDMARTYRDRAVLRLAGPLPCYSFVAAETSPLRVGN